jgi:hypothetical protein
MSDPATRLTFNRYVGPDGGQPNGPGGHVVEVGIAAWFDLDAPAVWVDAPLRPYDRDLPDGWMLADVLRRFRPGRTACAYGDAWADTGMLAGQHAASRADAAERALTAAIEAVGADCREYPPHTHAHAHGPAETHKHEHPYAVTTGRTP